MKVVPYEQWLVYLPGLIGLDNEGVSWSAPFL